MNTYALIPAAAILAYIPLLTTTVTLRPMKRMQAFFAVFPEAAIMEKADDLKAYVPGVLHHHERYDGSGYPVGLAGDAIPLEARIVAPADAYCAMTSERSYSPALSMDAALEGLRKGSGSQFDPELTGIFLKLMELRTSGLKVAEKALSNTGTGGTS